MKRLLILASAVATLAACGEQPQALGLPKSDRPASAGTGSNFTAPGWKAGDKASWEQHLKARQQNSQNDYSKMN
jgi:predicted small lipoprotein YifL